MEYIRFKQRLGQVKKLLLIELKRLNLASGCVLISSSSPKQSSRDLDFPFRQNSNFLYLSGSNLCNAILLISSSRKNPVLISSKPSKAQIIWDGPGINPGRLASDLGADFIDSPNIEAEALKVIQNNDLLFFNNDPESFSLRLANSILAMPAHQKLRYPKRLHNAEILFEPLRLIKDESEIKAIEAANKITNTALLCTVPLIQSGRSEQAIAASIDYGFKLQGAIQGFASIVATGSNAATLHHKTSLRKLRKGDLLLLDVGACHNNYNADISRTVCVQTKFSGVQSEVYNIVLSAQKAAIQKVRHNASVKSVLSAALQELCAGLKELGVIRQPVSRIIREKLYLPYFPHGIGHTLGLDVHDTGQMRADSDSILRKGMVITIEPGLYFPKSAGKVPACGVRIEDNLLVQTNQAKILSEGFPKSIKQIEQLLGS